MKISPYLLLALLAIGAASCQEKDLDVGYLYVPAVDVQASATSGDITQAVEHVRVVVEAQSLGFYPLPARVPILGTGERRIRIEPAVNPSGRSTRLEVYPFYEAYEQQFSLRQNQTDTIRPQLNYIPTAEFALVEDFVSGSGPLRVDLDEDAATSLDIVTDPLDPSRRVGMVTLTEEAPIFEIASEVLNRSEPIIEAWLELDYRGDATLSIALLPEDVGTEAERGGRYNQGVLPRDDWRKLYFDLNESILALDLYEGNFRISFLAGFDPEGPETQQLFLDNIKVVYR